jgi:hypothetical protein
MYLALPALGAAHFCLSLVKDNQIRAELDSLGGIR